MKGPPSPLRIVFFGSGNFAVPALRALVDSQDKVVMVVTSPPAKAGRGQTITNTSIAKMAEDYELKVVETSFVNNHDTLDAIERAQPELLVVVAFRGFLGPRLLSLGYTPPINIHPSLLPRHRGPAPVNWTLIKGDQLCGVSINFVDLKVDAGAVLAQNAIPVPEAVGSGEIEHELSQIGAKLLLQVIQQIKDDRLTPVPQNETLATINRLLKKSDGQIRFDQPASTLAHLINGVDPWPGAQAMVGDKLIKLFKAASCPGKAEPGQVLGLDDKGRLKIGTGKGLLLVSELQLEAKNRLAAIDFCRGQAVERLVPIPNG
ncbi:MAG: methionyl-tRNA formyltransferase [Deltaproteobacteria bacterium]|jgi:methionyl-tRNA formyltransferase|nr:methionyl-tRNA formyltransferase [Deltaproteobacteria bacterium]